MTPVKAIRRVVAGSVLCAARAHPDKVDPAIVSSIVKRLTGQLLAQFDIRHKTPAKNHRVGVSF
jgi:hypothetical protein